LSYEVGTTPTPQSSHGSLTALKPSDSTTQPCLPPCPLYFEAGLTRFLNLRKDAREVAESMEECAIGDWAGIEGVKIRAEEGDHASSVT
jgi:hypothetical protein